MLKQNTCLCFTNTSALFDVLLI